MDAGTWTALVGVIIAVVVGGDGIRRARAADKLAVGAGTRADEALELARRADERAERAERIAFEHNDIEWRRRENVRPGTLSYVNAGTSSAHNVCMVIDLSSGSWREEVRLDVVGPGELIGCHLPTSVRDAAIELHKQDRRGFMPGRVVSAAVDVLLTWQSEGGVPGGKAYAAVDVPV